MAFTVAKNFRSSTGAANTRMPKLDKAMNWMRDIQLGGVPKLCGKAACMAPPIMIQASRPMNTISRARLIIKPCCMTPSAASTSPNGPTMLI